MVARWFTVRLLYISVNDYTSGLILTDSAGGKWVLSVSTNGEVTIQALGE